MRIWNAVLLHSVCGALVVWAFPMSVPLVAQEAGPTVANTMAKGEARLGDLPDSPGATRTEQERSDSQEANNTQSSSSSSQTAQSSQAQSQTVAPPQKPVGTAAAESSNAGGISASQPAGVAIAPAKQHRVRTIVLRVGVLAAAGVAIGTVAAVSVATPSKPPGAH